MNSRLLTGVATVIVAIVIGAAFVVGADDDPTPAGGATSGRTATTYLTGGGATDQPAVEPTVAPVETPDLPDRGLHPEFLDIDGWLHSDVSSLEELRGTVVAVQFWTFGCRNCQATLPHMQDLYNKYRDQGFEIVGVHAPEFSYEAEVPNIEDAAAELGVTWPIVLDTRKRTFHSWQDGPSAFWPRIYLLDRAGHIRYDHIGEGGYAQTDAAVEALLAEPS